MANVVKYKKTGDINLQGGILLDALTASNVPNAESGKKTLFLDVADTTLKTKDSSGTVADIGGSSELPVTALGTSGTQTINRNTSDKWTLTPASAVTLATSNFTDMQEAEIQITNGNGLVSFPSDWSWQGTGLPILSDVNLIKIQRVGDLYFATPLGFYSVWSANKDTLAPLDSYMVSAWKLSDLNDSKGSNTLTNSGGVTFSSGKVGNAAVFSDNKRLSHSSSGNFITGTQDFTISAWVYITSADGTGRGVVVINDSGFANNIQIVCDSTNIACYGSVLDNVAGGNPPSINTWTLITATRIGNTLTLYKNATSIVTTPCSGSFATAAYTVSIGGYPANEGASIIGKVDEVYLWAGHGMTSDEVTALYNSGTGAFYK